ncbi:MAG: YicC/YloC family endoribonuclease [Pseudomonadota bacterium]
MTGFARCDGAHNTTSWYWEARSVNGKGLDVRLRMPPGHDELDAPVRAAVSKMFKRGNISVSLSLQRRGSPVEIRVNEDVLAQVIAAGRLVEDRVQGAAVTADAVLAVKGVLEVAEADETEDERKARLADLLAGFETCLKDLAVARETEGRHLSEAVHAHISEIETLTKTIAASPSRTPDAIAKRLHGLVSRLKKADQDFDEARLYQEAIVLATRADVEEELTRLTAHVHTARELMSEDGAIGRRLDFLAQEFNREANTICSKSNDKDVTQAGMALKVVIDQMREQVQNVE